jgi:penicillin-binding protein 2
MNRRLLVYRAIILFAFAILSLQLWRLQIVKGEKYRIMADQNRFRLVSIDAPRGVIYDRRGEMLARNIPRFNVAVIPAYLPKEEEEEAAVLSRLSELLGIPVSSVTASTFGFPPRPGIKEMIEEARNSSPYRAVTIKKDVDRETAFIIEEEHLGLPGVLVEIEPIREYPTGELTSHIIGYVGHIPPELVEEYAEKGYDPAFDKVGLMGVEMTFDEELRGKKGLKCIEVDAAGREIRTIGSPKPPEPGYSLILTIDIRLQRFMEEALRRGMEAAGSQSGVAIAMDPMTGEILGMVSLPSYDNNLFARGISADEYRILESNPWRPLMNHAISGQYPPGSAFKIIPAAAILEEGVVIPRTTVNCKGTLFLPNKYFPDKPELAQPFYCWIHKYGTGHGPTNIIAGIAQSCDIYFYQVSGGFEDFEGLGLEGLTKYARLFGLGERTGIELPGEGERPGLVPSEEWKRKNYGESWSTGDTYNVAIGQGFILVTPLQLLNATAAVANGGTLYRPKIVHRVISSSGEVIKHFEPEVIRKIPVSEENLKVVKDGMEAACIWGTAKMAYLEDVTVAAKTGSAEFPGPRDEKGNLPSHAWITAFSPVDEPEIALVVFVYGGKSGSKTAAPIAAEILRYYFDFIAD